MNNAFHWHTKEAYNYNNYAPSTQCTSNANTKYKKLLPPYFFIFEKENVNSLMFLSSLYKLFSTGIGTKLPLVLTQFCLLIGYQVDNLSKNFPNKSQLSPYKKDQKKV